MIFRYILTYFVLLFLLVITGFLVGCAQNRPLALNPPLYAQDKLQSADHWDNVANTVATRIQKSLEDRRDLINKPLYVQPPNDRPFSLAFYNLLRTRLVSKGMQVSDVKEADSLEIRYDVQTILHEDTAEWAPSLAAMGIGVANFVTGKYASRSEHEIIINTSMVHNNRFVMHLSTICYINDREWPMYMNAGGYSTGGAPSSSGSGPAIVAAGRTDPLWQKYASRGQAFAHCDQPAPKKTAQAPSSSAGKKRSAPKTTKKTPPKTAVSSPKPTPAPQSPLFPEPICPDGCIPAPKPATAGTSEKAAPPSGAPSTAGTVSQGVQSPSSATPSAPPGSGAAVTAPPAPPPAAPSGTL